MPFKSEKQRRFLWAKHPEIAQRWTNEQKKQAIKRRVTNNGKDKRT